ncbi:MAG TPA: DeoR family transcriptional regulator [Candidatus Paceibacterota bacterium]|nr:DeoR family transcriptional regulator [Candidatus Paceibacterota bacterium]
MDNTYKLNTEKNVLDLSKGQKIVAALYLVTGHLADGDPLRHAIRTYALDFLSNPREGGVLAEKIKNLINVGVFSRIISQQNATLILQELDRFLVHYVGVSPELQTLLSATAPTENTTYVHNMSFISSSSNQGHRKYSLVHKDKSKRRDDIMSFIKRQKSVGIKDISALFPDISEKTIQRELAALIQEGKISKRGSKRWSIYMALL